MGNSMSRNLRFFTISHVTIAYRRDVTAPQDADKKML
jgi:hypothetical protein